MQSKLTFSVNTGFHQAALGLVNDDVVAVVGAVEKLFAEHLCKGSTLACMVDDVRSMISLNWPSLELLAKMEDLDPRDITMMDYDAESRTFEEPIPQLRLMLIPSKFGDYLNSMGGRYLQ